MLILTTFPAESGRPFPELRPHMHRVHRDRALASPMAARRADRRRPQRYVETVLGSRHAAMERDHAPHAPEQLALRARNETGRTQAPANHQSLATRPGAVSCILAAIRPGAGTSDEPGGHSQTASRYRVNQRVGAVAGGTDGCKPMRILRSQSSLRGKTVRSWRKLHRSRHSPGYHIPMTEYLAARRV